MSWFVPDRRWAVAATYPLLGLDLGLANPFLGSLAQAAGVRPGVATAVTVNLLLPLAAVVLGYAHRRVALAWAGAVAMTAGLIIGLATSHAVGAADWSLAGLARAAHPILVAAMVGYAVLGTVAALVGRVRTEAVTPR
jgi:hypothetical protein